MTPQLDATPQRYRLSDFGPQLTWRTLYVILILLTAGLVASLLLHEPRIALRMALTLLLFLIGTALVYFAMRRQNNRLANRIIVGTVWFATLLQIIYTGTFHRGQGAFFIVVLILATILLGRTGTIVVGAMSVGGLLFGYYWGINEIANWNVVPNSLTMDYLTLLILFVMMVYIVQYMVQVMQRTFQGAQDQQQKMLQEQQRLTEQILMRRQTERSLHEANDELQASQKVLEERVQQRTEELAQANQDLETLLYVTSHDLREPLRAIQNFSQLVLRRYKADLGSTGCDSLEEVISSANQLDSVIEEILLLSRAQRLVTPSEWVAATEIVNEVLRRLEAQINRGAVKVTVGSPLPQLFADPQWLVEGLFQLLRNILFLTQADEAVHFEFKGAQGPAGPQLIIELADMHFSQAQRQSLFQLVGQQEATPAARPGSTLTLIDQIMQKHGGSAQIQTNRTADIAIVLTFDPREEQATLAMPV
ncbi:MAG: hypothetical protein KDE09_05955 [Anaerolineales bacterium]|nr:hypothetical protein [Anaerolineales bacterium]MCB8961184.1 hypothetical protein [Ardenticatenales bacterium]